MDNTRVPTFSNSKIFGMTFSSTSSTTLGTNGVRTFGRRTVDVDLALGDLLLNELEFEETDPEAGPSKAVDLTGEDEVVDEKPLP